MLKKTFIAAALLAVAAAIALPTAAHADPYTGTLSSNSVGPGGTFTYTVDTGYPSAPGNASLAGETNGAAVGGSIEAIVYGVAASDKFTTKPTGFVTLQVKVPSNARPGSTFTLSVDVLGFHSGPTFVIAGSPSVSAMLPHTGLNAVPFIWFGSGLLALGAALVVVLSVVRRSRRLPSQA